MVDIAIVGTGSFGTAIAIVLQKNGHRLRLHVREPDTLCLIEANEENLIYLPNHKLNLKNTHLTSRMSDAVKVDYEKNVDYVFVAVPSQNIYEVMGELRKSINDKTVIVLTSKGMVDDGISVSEIAKKTFPRNKICGLYGITFAELIAGGEGFSSMCIASEDEITASNVARLFINNSGDIGHFRIYTSNDLKGAEFGGAMKNIYAIAMGLYDGYLELGKKKPESILSRHSLLNLCIMEFIEFGLAYKANLYTLLGPSGVGDITACVCESSRNYTYGKWRASLEFKEKEAKSERAPSLHEGYDTVKSAKIVAEKCQVKTPILNAVYNILYNEDAKNRKQIIKTTITQLLEELSIIVELNQDNLYKQLPNPILIDPVPKIKDTSGGYISR